MPTIGFIGSGRIGGTVASLALAAGYDVVLSNSRGPDSLRDLVASLGHHAMAGTPIDAAATDLVVATIPLKAHGTLPAEALAGRIVIDTMNYYADRDGPIEELLDGTNTSSQMVAAHLHNSSVVKGFNNIYYEHLAALATRDKDRQRTALPIAGDSTVANLAVTEFLDRIGYDAVLYGGLADSWRSQPGTPVYGTPYAADPSDWSAGPAPADADKIRTAVAQARRP